MDLLREQIFLSVTSATITKFFSRTIIDVADVKKSVDVVKVMYDGFVKNARCVQIWNIFNIFSSLKIGRSSTLAETIHFFDLLINE